MKNLSKGQLKAIATKCSEFDARGGNRFTSTLNDGFLDSGSTSCENCNHYIKRHCNLNLIDEIMIDM